MPLDGLAFAAVARELRAAITNARIQGIFQPTANELLFHLRQPGRTHRLLVSIEPSLARLHLTALEPVNPLAPPPFCQLLRKHLVPGRILTVEARDESGSLLPLRLYFDIMGRHSNVVLTQADGTILDAMKRIAPDQNRHRELLPHRPYVPPPAQSRINPLDLDQEAFSRLIRLVPAHERPAKVLAESLAGFSPLAGREVVARAGLSFDITREELSPAGIEALWAALQEVITPLQTGR